MSRWLKFVEYNPYRIDRKINRKKTTEYWVSNRDTGVHLGTIKWYGPFRKYSFFPQPDTVFEQTCLQDITNFVVQLERERRERLSLKS